MKRRKNRLNFLHRGLKMTEECRDNAVDRISQLPDDILISIISRLTLQEATSTSILSTRWRYLWTYITCLNFPPFKPEIPLNHYERKTQEIREKKFPNYINMINRTLDSHKGYGVLREFRVHMHCVEGLNIQRWLEFALNSGVEVIDIRMVYYSIIYARHGYYTLQLSKLIRMYGGQSLPGLRSLKELSLSAVHVDDGEVELLLSSFPLLERLSIALSQRLRNVSIVGRSVFKLKHLDISYATNLESIEIDNMINLVYLRCYGLRSAYVLRLNNVPKFTDFNISDEQNNTHAEILPRIPSCIRDQLLLLKLWTCCSIISNQRHVLPELINVKHLELENHMQTYGSTFHVFHLIAACRSLEKLEMKFLWKLHDTEFKDKEIFDHTTLKKLSPNFKKLKLSGYLGSPQELEFALFIIKNVAALEELIVEPCDLTKKIRRTALARAREHFQPIIPKSVNLVMA